MPTLTSTETAQARNYFEKTQSLVLEATRGLTEAQWRFKPAPDRWSIAETLEHMVTVQDRVLGPIWEQLMQAPRPAEERDVEKIDALVLEKIPDRSVKAKVPPPLEPKGEIAPAEALERWARNYGVLSERVEDAAALRAHAIDSPPLKVVTGGAISQADGYQWALTLAAHDERHVRQMEEIKAQPGYPG